MELISINKVYNQNKQNEVKALKNINIKFDEGKFYAIMGRSGSGKTTLINILGLMDSPTSGTYILNGQDTNKLKENEISILRSKSLGFVFQSYYLESKLTALENVILPSLINNKLSKAEREKRAKELLDKLGLVNRLNHYPHELSGGECQRVAIARALMNDPSIIIADEPTGNLDSKNELEIFGMLKSISNEGKTIIVVSHDEIVKNYADIILKLKDGELSYDK